MQHENIGLNMLKVIMILFVIFIHENPTYSTHGEFIMWWHSIVVVAVPVFFTLSGYFFFKGISFFCYDIYKKKIKKRIKSLFVPYILWNCMPIVFVFAGNLYSIIFRGKSTEALYSFFRQLWDDGIWHIWWDKTSGLMPFDSPLWYVRDLIILCIFSPIIYWIIHRIGWLFPIIVGALYLTPLSFPVGFSSTGILFFSIGANLATKSMALDVIPKLGQIIILLFAICSFILCNVYGNIWQKIFLIFSCYSWILLFHVLNGSLIERVAKFSETVFFTLALHNIFVLANVGKILSLFLPNNFSYWLAPFITLFICVLLYYIIKRLCPKIIVILSGGR